MERLAKGRVEENAPVSRARDMRQDNKRTGAMVEGGKLREAIVLRCISCERRATAITGRLSSDGTDISSNDEKL